MQAEPPFAGGGLSHDLYRVEYPPPHVLEHVPHAPHTPQSPFTVENKLYVWFIKTTISQYCLSLPDH